MNFTTSKATNRISQRYLFLSGRESSTRSEIICHSCPFSLTTNMLVVKVYRIFVLSFVPKFCSSPAAFRGERGMMHYPADHELAEAKLFHQRHWHAAPSLLFSVFRGGTSNLLLGSKDCNNTCATQENNTSKKSRKLIEKFMLVCWRGLYTLL